MNTSHLFCRSSKTANYRNYKENTLKKIRNLILLASALGVHAAQAEQIDLKSAHGTVLIAAPTAINGPTNQGVWFIKGSTKAFSLNLPALNANQVYEGWIVDDCTGMKISTGIFRTTGTTDSDAAGKYAGPLSLNYPAVPGSDFITLGQDLADGGHNVVITVEPYPDLDVNPSGVGVLRVNIPEGTAVGTELTFTNIAQ